MTDEITKEDLAQLRQRADRGDQIAQYNLGLLLKQTPALGQPGEFKRWLAMAAASGDTDAYWDIAEAYIEGVLVDQDYSEAHAWLTKGAELNDPVCLYNLGVQYVQGDGVEPDPVRAFDCFRRAAELGDTNARFNLAMCFFKGLGTPVDLISAQKWARTVQAAGDQRGEQLLNNIARNMNPADPVQITLSTAEAGALMRELAMRQVAELQQDAANQAAAPPSVPAPPTPLEQLKAAAASGNPMAQMELARSLKDAGSDREAVSWLARAAEAGNPEAQFQLGDCYVRGQGVEADVFKARAHFANAARQGHAAGRQALEWINVNTVKAEAATQALKNVADSGDPGAQYELAMRYRRGEFATPDLLSAARYFEKAANQGHLESQFVLYALYEQGQGVPKSRKQSFTWLARAAAAGHGDAMFFFGRRYSDGRLTSADVPNAGEIFARCQTLFPELRDPADTEENPAENIIKLETAAAGNDLRATFLLAMAYIEGEGTEKRVDLGLEMLQRLVSQDYAAAQFEMARRYGLGDEVPRDHQAGKALAIKAAQQGYGQARMMLETLFQVSRDEVAQIPQKQPPAPSATS